MSHSGVFACFSLVMSAKTLSPITWNSQPASITDEARSARLADLRQRRAEALDVIAEGLFTLLVREQQAHPEERASRRGGGVSA
ncbi:hypothetical protein JQX13_53040 [Archangium violaceum]|uniref:hypothetical protein n=1 Tax=Archangium violaceum TaxID=83451 RepID=UPI00193B8D71|nr:hypothetical protein [Archangium violaceum]QRK08532.1 hypothetical protein JQX13_53040 [Archangium violaceum]